MIQELIRDLCRNLEFSLNTKEKIHEVTHISRSIRHFNHVEFIVEILVDKICIFREGTHIDNAELDTTFLTSKEVIIENLEARLLSAVFNYGVMSSKKFIDDTETSKPLS